MCGFSGTRCDRRFENAAMHPFTPVVRAGCSAASTRKIPGRIPRPSARTQIAWRHIQRTVHLPAVAVGQPTALCGVHSWKTRIPSGMHDSLDAGALIGCSSGCSPAKHGLRGRTATLSGDIGAPRFKVRWPRSSEDQEKRRRWRRGSASSPAPSSTPPAPGVGIVNVKSSCALRAPRFEPTEVNCVVVSTTSV